MANPIKILKNGIINENPTFVQVIGIVLHWLLPAPPSTVSVWVFPQQQY